MIAKERGKRHIGKLAEGAGRREYYHWPFEGCAPCLEPLLARAGSIRSLRLNNDDSCVHFLLLPNDLLERGDLKALPVSMA